MKRECCFIGKQAYFYSHLLPAAIAYRRAHGRPAPTVLMDNEKPPGSAHVEWIRATEINQYRYAVGFDTWALIAGSVRRRRTAYLHHSLVGKGLVFKGRRPYWPLFLSDAILLPEPARAADLPGVLARKTHATGHLPMDWLGLDASEAAPEVSVPLSRLQEAAGRSFTIVCLFTHGRFGAINLLRETFEQGRIAAGWANTVWAVRYHGYIPPSDRLRSGDYLELGDVPSPLAARYADLVLADHGSAALEAVALGRKVLCFESPALIALRKRLSFLSELRYLEDREHVELFRTPEELRMLVARAISAGRRPEPACAAAMPSAGERLQAFLAARLRQN
jgi:hypothetical protein